LVLGPQQGEYGINMPKKKKKKGAEAQIRLSSLRLLTTLLELSTQHSASSADYRTAHYACITILIIYAATPVDSGINSRHWQDQFVRLPMDGKWAHRRRAIRTTLA
jgi:hypothetical protein